MVAIRFFKMLIRMPIISIQLIKNQHFLSTLLVGGRGSHKKYSVYAFDNVDNSGQPLIYPATEIVTHFATMLICLTSFLA